MREFLELMERNEELKNKVAQMDADIHTQVSDYIALAAEYGVELTEADFQPASAGELSEDELDAVAGGKTCACVMGGGGTGEDVTNTKTCACVMGGGGQMQDGAARCHCVLVGTGADEKEQW